MAQQFAHGSSVCTIQSADCSEHVHVLSTTYMYIVYVCRVVM